MAPQGAVTAQDDQELDTAADDAFENDDLEAGVAGAIDEEGGETAGTDDDVIEDHGSLLDDEDDAAPAEGGAGAGAGPGPDRGDGRDTTGKFAKTAQEKAADAAAAAAGKKPAGDKGAKPDAGASAKLGPDGKPLAAVEEKPAAATAQAPKWEAFTVKADRQIFPIDGAQVTKITGTDGQPRMLIAVPEKQFQEFNHRIARGISAERRWREIVDRERQMELAASAPKPPSEAEIEAKIMLEAIKPFLPELLDAQQMENLELKVKNAQLLAKTEFAQAEDKRRSDSAEGSAWQKTQWSVMVDEAFALVEHATTAAEDDPISALKGMDPELIKEVLRDDAAPFRDKIVYKEDGEVLVNNEALFRMLKRAKLAAGGTTAPAAAAAAPAPAKAGTPGAADKPTAGDRFNKGQDTAAKPDPKPGTTSLKAGRDSGRPPAERRPPSSRRDPSSEKTAQQIAEDSFRNTTRRMRRSDTLDFEDDEEGD